MDIYLCDEEWKSTSNGLVWFNESIDIDDLATIVQRDIEEITNEITDGDKDDDEENDSKSYGKN